MQLGIDEYLDAEDYLGWYRVLNHGYPFLDYAKEGTLAADGDLMKGYAAEDPAPPAITRHQGKRFKLSEGRFQARSLQPQPPSESLIAGWLRIAAGITGTRQLNHSQAVFRTSPSGGARHPTDLGVCLTGNWADGMNGCWWYDPLSHELVSRETGILGVRTESAHQPTTVAVFTVSSHVRRAMWRYRDARAFRPVIIDAGHVVETLLSVITYAGWVARWYEAPGIVEVDGDLDPIFGYVVASRDTAPVEFIGAMPPSERPVESTSLRTNPLISLRALPEGLVGENHQRHGTELLLSAGMVDALAYATPSTRKDRPTHPSDLTNLYVSPDELAKLCDGGFLLPEAEGDTLWAQTNVWSEHDWFLSLLAHYGEVSELAATPTIERLPAERSSTNLPQALDLRRTARALKDDQLPPSAVKALMGHLPSNPKGVRIILSTKHGFDALESGTYSWRHNAFELIAHELPREKDVTTAAIGQPWAQQFSCIFWIIPDPTPEPGGWVGAFIECGRIAQSLCLGVCADPSIGVFQSPALIDEKLSELLGTAASIDGAYLVGIGMVNPVASEREKHTQSLFKPSKLFHEVG
jgi:hypothetical protein